MNFSNLSHLKVIIVYICHNKYHKKLKFEALYKIHGYYSL